MRDLVPFAKVIGLAVMSAALTHARCVVERSRFLRTLDVFLGAAARSAWADTVSSDVHMTLEEEVEFGEQRRMVA